MKHTNLLLIAFLALGLTACETGMDYKPKAQQIKKQATTQEAEIEKLAGKDMTLEEVLGKDAVQRIKLKLGV
jgi:cell division protein FtsB